ncbi:hypothetical protein AC578_3330 [Pseudocercospora eumusae]|uniref:Uncharacterized protein n=1 Tax=Pseudocercospora eumusae TaxID=321146 RepID=A0A139GVI0_9PEZI|nr:hypothetical protein AC578_3330 [Pseudocercospora eumusae]
MAGDEESAATRASPTIKDKLGQMQYERCRIRGIQHHRTTRGDLLKVDPRQLLLSQRVRKQWKSVIEGSINIEKALFLEIGEASVASPGRCALESAITYHDDMQVFGIFNSASPKDLGCMMEPLTTCGVQPNFLLMPLTTETRPFSTELHRYPPVSLRIFDVDFCSLWAMEPRHPRPHREPRIFRSVRTFGELIDVKND